MKVFKFGGASVNQAAGFRKVTAIIRHNTGTPLLVVISALGKTTNALEMVFDQFRNGGDFEEPLRALEKQHQDIITDLLGPDHLLHIALTRDFMHLRQALTREGDYDQGYDQAVSWGEIFSSRILAGYLQHQGIATSWLDARKLVLTDSSWREGKVDWQQTLRNCQQLQQLATQTVLVTQGFLGADNYNRTVTLGRDGSDFTAAIFASCLHAESVTIWKDVPGVMNADPKRIQTVTVFEELPYREAAEMTFYGASVIHPKTIKPLAQKHIPLYVRSFDNPAAPGTKIHDCFVSHLPPLIVFKDNQCLISCKVTDYTFLHEGEIANIFKVLSKLDVKINVMQNSAISFSFCMDFRDSKVNKVIAELSRDFEVYYNTNLTLITIKNYDGKTFEEYRKKPGVILEQSSRSTLQVLVKGV